MLEGPAAVALRNGGGWTAYAVRGGKRVCLGFAGTTAQLAAVHLSISPFNMHKNALKYLMRHGRVELEDAAGHIFAVEIERRNP